MPHLDGTSILIKLAGGTATTVATGLTRVLGLAFDCQGRAYALETATTGIFFPPGTGRLLRLNSGGLWDVLVTNLTLPAGMTIRPRREDLSEPPRP